MNKNTVESHTCESSQVMRYFTSGSLSNPIEYVWMVFHGYGQLARYFIRKFEVLNSNHFIIAPEGSHRFYLEGTQGRVGASWMTREARELDLHNQKVYLDTISDYYAQQIPHHAKWIVLGFSQGTATAMRWLNSNQIPVHRLILWAGTIPQDLVQPKAGRDWSSVNTTFVYGDQDPYLTSNSINSVRDWVRHYEIQVQENPYTGEHRIEPEVLKAIVSRF
jgi:predicted esterase